GAVDFLRLCAGADLLEEFVDAVAESVFEIPHAAEDRVGEDEFLQVAGGVERGLAPHVINHQPTGGAGDFAALHRMAALDVIGPRQAADDAVLEFEAEVRGTPDLAARGFGRETLD